MEERKNVIMFDQDKTFGRIDTFREAALHFKEFGRYHNFTPNSHPSSQYMKFWKEERRRCVEGYNVGWDWIPGYFYFYLNYSPIFIVEAMGEGTAEGRVEGKRFKDFPKFWDGDYYYYHYLDEAERAGGHASVLKTRGRGYSFKGGSMLCRNYFLIPGSKSYAMASEWEYLTSDGLLNKAWDNMGFLDTHTAWAKRRQFKNTETHRRASYQKTDNNGVKVEAGYKSEIIGVSLKDNPDKARGKRGKLILYEEAGKFPGLLKAWQVARPSMEQGKITFGLMIAFGTGGTEDANFEALEELFYYPKAYNIHPLSCKNKWDKGRENTDCAFFMPVTMNYEFCYDEKGNSNEDKAKGWEEEERRKVKENSSDATALDQYIAENPFNPQEAVMRWQGTIFPVNDLKNQLSEIEVNRKKYVDSAWVGRLAIDNESGKIKWKPDNAARPIIEFPIRDNKNMAGCPIIYEMPYEDSTGKVPHGMYIAGTDPYDHDESQTNSLGSTFIMNVLTERIVAEYTGRPATADEYYEGVRRMLVYYNAECNYENNLRGMFNYFKKKDSLHLLSDTPEVLVDKEVMGSAMMNRKKGTPASVAINKWARELIKSWLINEAPGEDEIMNLQKIRSIPLLKELIYWNKDGNFDRVSALGMLLILKQERIKHVIETETRVKRIADDPYWDRAFKKQSFRL
jgi:hypothetical protein